MRPCHPAPRTYTGIHEPPARASYLPVHSSLPPSSKGVDMEGMEGTKDVVAVATPPRTPVSPQLPALRSRSSRRRQQPWQQA